MLDKYIVELLLPLIVVFKSVKVDLTVIVALDDFSLGKSVRLKTAVYSPGAKSTIHPSPLKP